MYRVSIKIERLPVAIRRTPQTQEGTPELYVQAKGSSPEDAIARALRILNGEQTAIQEAKPITAKLSDDDDEDEVEL